jgi:hypothetical protein
MEWSRVQVVTSHAGREPKKDGNMNDHPSLLPAAGRLLIAVIFSIRSRMKVTAPTMTQAYIAAVALPAPKLPYVLAILIAYKTRIAGAVVALYCVAFQREHCRSESDDAVSEESVNGRRIASGCRVRCWHLEHGLFRGSRPLEERQRCGN